ncbi:MAG: hypothetical protein IT410_04040 [Candidatus Doudnabacteria bacterium]|nr:hypothetical protein [Candidatus Doudnabacteria bacterium]
MDNQSASPEAKQPSILWKRIKTIAKGIAIFIVVLIVAAVWQSMNQPQSQTQSQGTAQQAEEPKEEQTPAKEPPVEPFNIEVTSQIVKKVDGKYRYFFDIRNKDTKNFEGAVTINLLRANNSRLGSDTFTTTRAIEPNLGFAQYIEINSGPMPMFDSESAITKFTYEVKIDKKSVKSGEGVITDKFENLDY